jgi:hypothetical protein
MMKIGFYFINCVLKIGHLRGQTTLKWLYFCLHSNESLKMLSSQKRGGSRRVPIDRLNLIHNRQYFLGTPKGLLFCFKFQKTGFSV